MRPMVLAGAGTELVRGGLASEFAAMLGPRRPTVALRVAFVDRHRIRQPVSTICAAIGLAPSTYYAVKKRERDPSERVRKDRELAVAIRDVWLSSDRTYGARKVWRELQNRGVDVARCTVERLMRNEGMRGSPLARLHQVEPVEPVQF
ncbi:IS3 family transposase [Amycolatopsis albispora]